MESKNCLHRLCFEAASTYIHTRKILSCKLRVESRQNQLGNEISSTHICHYPKWLKSSTVVTNLAVRIEYGQTPPQYSKIQIFKMSFGGFWQIKAHRLGRFWQWQRSSSWHYSSSYYCTIFSLQISTVPHYCCS